MSMGRTKQQQGAFWVESQSLRGPGHPFFERLNRVLFAHDFDRKVEALCADSYADRHGRPSIPPGVYFRMLMVGYFEGIDSERGIAWRCQDSSSLKSFIGIDLGQPSPDHSTLSVIRRRLPADIFQEVFKAVLAMMHAEGLLKGHKLALDSSLMDANAAMRSIVRKDTNETYSGYVERLASASGEPAVTRSEQARFDKKREKRTTSNADWASTTDPEAKIAKMKDGRTHLAYKPEHAVDIDSGAIIAATVNPADSSDHSTATSTLVQVTENLEHIELSSSGFTVVADKGYHAQSAPRGE